MFDFNRETFVLCRVHIVVSAFGNIRPSRDLQRVGGKVVECLPDACRAAGSKRADYIILIGEKLDSVIIGRWYLIINKRL